MSQLMRTIWIALFWSIFFFLFCWLGVWQLHRYQFKKNLLATYQQPVIVKGQFDNTLTMLIQNKMRNNQIGYELLIPLVQPDNKKLLLVDLGWISNADSQSIKPVKGLQQIKGYIKLLNEYQFILGENILHSDQFPLVMQKIDIDAISKITHKTFYPYVLSLTMPQVAVTPERHLAYAVQWFAMAVVLLIAVVVYIRR